MTIVQPHPQGLIINVIVIPRSSKNLLAGRHGDALKIKLTAPPVDGRANKMCIRFLADCLGLPRSALEIVSGQTSRTKRVLVICEADKITQADLEKRVSSLFDRIN